MRIKQKTRPDTILLFFLLAFACLSLTQLGNNAEPFALPLAFAAASAGVSPFAAAGAYALSALTEQSLSVVLLYLGQAALLLLAFLLQKRLPPNPFVKSGAPTLLFLSVGLGLFVGLAPFTPYTLPFAVKLPSLLQKAVLAALLFLFSAVTTVAMKALLHKFLRCRLRSDEVVFIVITLVAVGAGVFRFLGFNAYMGIAFFVLLLYAYLTKTAEACLCAFVLSLPPLFCVGEAPTRMLLYGVAVALFIRSGRIATVCALLALYFAFGYLDGLYLYPTARLVAALLAAVLPCLVFVVLPVGVLREAENKLHYYRERHLSRIAINRNRAAIGEQLFELSAVFREIEAAFSALGTDEAERSAKEYMRGCVLEESCKLCPEREQCAERGGQTDLDLLIDVGCQKGRVSLLDVPTRLAESCPDQSGVLYAVNRQIGEYKKYMTEAENAASGRAMLAGQAQGVSLILKNLALEQSEPLRLYTDKERALSNALLAVGIVCTELLIYGEEGNYTLSLVTFGKVDVKRIAAVASSLFGVPMTISERLPLCQDKFCCILRQKPCYDAAFGVASVVKTGEQVGGDAHSVIKIDERRFMVVLSDGMGSGEYAKRISESTVSLLESFYRAKMPPALVLSSINRLLTFNKEETFACVDVAVVDLDSGAADVVKIGAPVGFILSGTTVKVLENHSLPLGILDSLRPETAEYTLAENDVLLFVSDGVSDAFGSASDLYEALRGISTKNPQQLADGLLERALHAYGGTAKDDMTVVAVRLFKTQAAA